MDGLALSRSQDASNEARMYYVHIVIMYVLCKKMHTIYCLLHTHICIPPSLMNNKDKHLNRNEANIKAQANQ